MSPLPHCCTKKKKKKSFEVKVTIGTYISPKLSNEGLLKDVMGAAV